MLTITSCPVREDGSGEDEEDEKGEVGERDESEEEEEELLPPLLEAWSVDRAGGGGEEEEEDGAMAK